jgi:hypothetical protein
LSDFAYLIRSYSFFPEPSPFKHSFFIDISLLSVRKGVIAGYGAYHPGLITLTWDRGGGYLTVVIEKRLYRRVKVRWPTALATSQGSVDGVTRNISIDGAFLYYSQPDLQALPLRTDDRVNIVFDVPGDRQIRTSARVAWSDILAVEESSTLLGVGLQFLDVASEAREFLLTAITEEMYRAKSEGVRME